MNPSRSRSVSFASGAMAGATPASIDSAFFFGAAARDEDTDGEEMFGPNDTAAAAAAGVAGAYAPTPTAAARRARASSALLAGAGLGLASMSSMSEAGAGGGGGGSSGRLSGSSFGSGGSFGGARRRHQRTSSLFDADDEEDEAATRAAATADADAAATGGAAAATAAAAAASSTAAAAAAPAAAAASASDHSSAASSSIAVAAFSTDVQLPVDEDLERMLASFSPSLQLELAGADGAGPLSPSPMASLSASSHAGGGPPSTRSPAPVPFFASTTAAARLDEDEFDRWGTGVGPTRGSAGALFSDLFGEAGATSSSSTAVGASGATLAPASSTAVAPARGKLEDRTFSVWTTDERGVQRPHQLRLTPAEIQLLNADGSVSKSFPYSDVFCVTCQEAAARPLPVAPGGGGDGSVAADGVVRTVSISFISDADLSFLTPHAVQLNNELNERINMRNSADTDAAHDGEGEGSSAGERPAAAGNEFAWASASASAAAAQRLFAGIDDTHSYQEKLMAQDGSGSSSASSDTSVFFTPSFAAGSSRPDPAVRPAHARSASVSVQPPPTDTTATAAATSDGPVRKRRTEGPSGFASPAVAAAAKPSGSSVPTSGDSVSGTSSRSSDPAYEAWQRKYLLDQRIQSLIDRVWLDPSSEEGKARAKFLRAFPALESKPATLCVSTRKFLDSFRTYMEKKKFAQLQAVIVGPVAEAPATGEATADASAAPAPASASASAPTPASGGLLSLSEFESTFHARVERSAEVGVLMPILPRLVAAVAALPASRDADALLVRQMALLRGRSQSHFGIPLQHQSPSGWKGAVRELVQIERFDLPCDKLEVLLGTAKAIYSAYKHERMQTNATAATSSTGSDEASSTAVTPAVAAAPAAAAPGSSMFLPADDFFPIFIFVVSQTPLRAPATLKHLMWNLCDPAALQSEGGYYLTVFDAAIEYIRTVDPDKPQTNTTKKRA